MHFSRYQSFRMDSFLLFISNLIFLIGTIVFWYVVNDVGFIVDGWTYAQILVFIALSELFYTFEQNIFSVAALFWQVIYTGSIDTQLIRPMDPRKRFLLLNIDYLGLLVGFVKVFLILRIANIYLEPWKLFISIVLVFLANYTLMLIQFSICYAAFCSCKIDFLTQFCDSFIQFNKYPLVILPQIVKVLFQTLLPFYFFSTFPAEFVLDKVSGPNLMFMLLGLAGSIILWTCINKTIWNWGRTHYESING